ncbi:Mediator complex subunit Med14 [Penicillium longicatenatum]|uniref:Mediator complex subunit Med14 n=1 Tax=Penicillium longicatenatum TaxID=1561947 RepID=UPI0025490FEE|nr:Mediator complex subunit Med14 [Penicillium longicatenatum]KAJ5650019.1 Mediator complex subunit Med14 [Penicillium longicatenatum]
MPGVIMENAGVDGSLRQSGLNDTTNGAPSHDKSHQLPAPINGPVHVNGMSKDVTALSQTSKTAAQSMDRPATAFELPHITQGFFPFGTLVNRAAQQCWIDLSELVTELASVSVSSETSSLPAANGKPLGNQSVENVNKKVRILDFAHAKRAEFIKLLVLSQWSRQATEVSRLIDIQGFIRARHQAYLSAVQYVGEMKRDLVRAQVANPDLKTALEVLSKGRVVTLPDLGYKPPKPLTARATLKKLHKINRIISVRLALYDQVPPPLRNYRVHDGRVTFTVPGEFELDLSVAEEANTSQFFFVDIRFLFSPSSPIPKGRIFDQLDAKINEILHTDGLMGCFDFLHGLVLTNKINTLFKQAADLARGLWLDALRIELLRRTLVVQYWPARAGPKSWLEIGVQRGLRNNVMDSPSNKVPRIGLRWMRDGQQANSNAVHFDSNELSMERLLRSVIALHTSHLLSTAYAALNKSLLFSNHVLSLRAQLSSTEPGECHLDVQLTSSRSLRVSVEPLSGTITLSGAPMALDRLEPERHSNKSAIDELLTRVARLRCATAIEEIECGTKALGLENVDQRGLGLDIRRLFPLNTMRSAFFTHPLWDRRWVVAATSSMDGDSWWLVQLRSAESNNTSPAHPVSTTLMSTQRQFDYLACAELLHALTGMLAIYANARFLAEIPDSHFYPSLKGLQLGSDLQVPDMIFRYKPAALPSSFRIALPAGIDQGSYLQDTVRLSFHGVDRQNQSAVLVAYGGLRYRVNSLLSLISKANPSILMQNKGSGFALRLLVPAGTSIMVSLFERLQRFDCVLSILQSLIQQGMEPRSLSLSQVAFLYGPDQKFAARFDIDVSSPSLSDCVDAPHAVFNTDPIFRRHLKVNFDSPSPHRRIQEPLTVALNHRFSETGVDSILGFMTDTFPLLQCLDQLTRALPTESSTVHVIARSPMVFQFHYPRLNYRFRLSARPRQGRRVWLLEDSNRSNSPEDSHSASTVKDKIYNSKGDGWQGMGDGAVSSLEKIGNLLCELHSSLSACPPEPMQTIERQGEQASTAEQHSQGHAVINANLEIASPQKTDIRGNADVITID